MNVVSTLEPEEPLASWGSGEQLSRSRRLGDVVLRMSGPWSATVLALLAHFEANGFDGAPRVVGTGLADDGRESVTFLPGGSPHPHAWPDDEALFTIGNLLRRAHDAAATFTAPSPPNWKPWFGRDLPGRHPVIGHCDTGPWNIVTDKGLPYAFIDWEYAGSVDAIWELAQATWLNAQLHDDDIAERHGLPSAAARATQARHLLDGYRLPVQDRIDFVDTMIEFAVHSARAEAVEHSVTDASTRAVSDTGYPILWAVTWRARSASWMLRNRTLIERALASVR